MKSKRHDQPIKPIIWLGLGVLGLVLSFCVATLMVQHSANQRGHQKFTMPMKIVFPEILEILGSDWESQGIRDIVPLEDIKGRPSSLILGVREGVYNIYNENHLAFVAYSVFAYTDVEAAQDRFEIQDDVIFFQFDHEQFRWSNSDLIQNVVHNAGERHAGCQSGIASDGELEMRCAAVLRYGRYIVFVNMFPIRDDVEYIDDTLITNIFMAIDAKMSGVLTE